MADIEVAHLSKRYGPVAAVEDLSFVARAGRVTGFLGANGAGKTTTLRVLLGLAAPTGGAATVGGRRYAELGSPAREVGAVLEATAFHPGRTARHHLAVLAVAAGLPRRRVEAALAEVGLAAAADRRVGGFSLGMRQRLALAAAMLGDPGVLVLDEPANGLDPEAIRWLREWILGRADEGRTLLVSSHQLAELALVVDDVVIIDRGRLVRAGPLAELAAAAGERVLVRTPHAERLRSVLADRGIAAEPVGPDELVVTGASAESVGLAAADAGAVIYGMVGQRSGLEELYLTTKAQAAS
jgi:ABC-2 type transport system ATP-binding protein